MPDFAKPLARLITDFKRLPGIGRFTSYAPRATTPNSSPKPCWMSTTSWASAVSATTSATAICASSAAILTAILGIEVTRQFNGLYRVLHGALSPLKGIGPERPWKAAGRRRAGKLDFLFDEARVETEEGLFRERLQRAAGRSPQGNTVARLWIGPHEDYHRWRQM